MPPYLIPRRCLTLVWLTGTKKKNVWWHACILWLFVALYFLFVHFFISFSLRHPNLFASCERVPYLQLQIHLCHCFPTRLISPNQVTWWVGYQLWHQGQHLRSYSKCRETRFFLASSCISLAFFIASKVKDARPQRGTVQQDGEKNTAYLVYFAQSLSFKV